MKLTIALSLLLVVVSVLPAMGQYGGYVDVYTDYPGFTDCALQEVVGQVNSVWVVHQTASEGSGAKFKIVTDWDASQLPTDYHGTFVISGDVYTGVEVSYASYTNPAVPGCAPLPVIVAELRFMPMSVTPCGPTVSVVPHPDAASGMVEVMDCSDNIYTAGPGSDPVLVNGVSAIWDPFSRTQTRGPAFVACECGPVKAEHSTWSSIKSLYR